VDKLNNLVGHQALEEAVERSGKFDQDMRYLKMIGGNESMEVYASVLCNY